MHIEKKTLKNIFLGSACLIVLYWLLHETDRVKAVIDIIGGVIFPFALGAALAFIFNVPTRGFEGLLRKVTNGRLRRALAIVLTIVSVLLVLAGVFWLLIPQLVDTVESLVPKLTTFVINTEKTIKQFLSENPELMEWISKNTELETINWSSLVQNMITVVGNSVSTILSGTFSAIGSVAGVVMDVVIALVFSVYCLFQKETLARQGRKLIYAFLPEKTSDQIIRVLRLSNSTFSNFLSGQCIEVCILGCLFAISMAIFRMPYIPLVSVLVAVTAFIPVVGAWVGCIFGAFFIFVANPLLALWFIVMFIVLQQIENNLIYPRVVGTSIGLSGMWVLVAVGVGGELMGVAGMFLMIPFASVIYTLIRERTARRLEKREIDPEKLKCQPPEIVSKFKEKRDNKRKKESNTKK